MVVLGSKAPEKGVLCYHLLMNWGKRWKEQTAFPEVTSTMTKYILFVVVKIHVSCIIRETEGYNPE